MFIVTSNNNNLHNNNLSLCKKIHKTRRLVYQIQQEREDNVKVYLSLHIPCPFGAVLRAASEMHRDSRDSLFSK